MQTFVTHLESALDGTRLEAGKVHTVHQGRPLWVRYDLQKIGRAVRPESLVARPPSLWRYRELLPLPFDDEPVTLGEGMTPLLPCPRLGRECWACPACASRTNRSCRPAASRAAA